MLASRILSMDSSWLIDNILDIVDEETRGLDLVASWEELCGVYKVLEFTDDIKDEQRIEEFKWVIKQMNAHLSRARKKLLSCKNPQTAQEVLIGMFNPSENVKLTNRMELAYHKLKQQWIKEMLRKISDLEAEALENELTERMESDGELY